MTDGSAWRLQCAFPTHMGAAWSTCVMWNPYVYVGSDKCYIAEHLKSLSANDPYNQSINQSIKKIIPHKLQSSTTYSSHQGSNVERGK